MTRMPVIMKLAKCFFTEEMPADMIRQIKYILKGDYGYHHVDTANKLSSLDQWFVDNGAVRGERIFIERGGSGEIMTLAEKRETVAKRQAKARRYDGESSTNLESEFYSLLYHGCAGVINWTEEALDEWLASHDEEGQSIDEEPGVPSEE
jgi:hypothetical protein